MDKTDNNIKIETKKDVKKYTNALKKAISTAIRFSVNNTEETFSHLSNVIDFENEKVYPCITLDHGMFNPWISVYAPSKSVIVDSRIPLDIVFKLGAIANNDVKSKYFGVTQASVINIKEYRKVVDIIYSLDIKKTNDNKWDMTLPKTKSSSWDKQYYPDRYNDKDRYPDMIPLVKSFYHAREHGTDNLIDKEELINTFFSLLLTQSQSSVPYFNKDTNKEEYIHTFYTNFPIKVKSLEFHKNSKIKDGVVETSVLVVQNIGTHNIFVFYKYVDIWNDMREEFKDKLTTDKD